MKKNALSVFSFLFCSIAAYSQTAYTVVVGMDEIDEKAYKIKYERTYDSDGTAYVWKDILAIKRIISPLGHQITELRGKQATQAAILQAITDIGKKIKPGEQFTLYYAGHGDLVPDKTGDEASGFDQVLVAYDDFVVDDKIDMLLNRYFTKTQNIMIVDACHSGSSYKMKDFLVIDFKMSSGKKQLYINEKKALKQTEKLSTCIFDEIIDEPYSLVYLGATPDGKLSIGNGNGGLLTYCMDNIYRRAIEKETWKQYTFRRLACELMEEMGKSKQHLEYHEVGKNVTLYSAKQPFKLK